MPASPLLRLLVLCLPIAPALRAAEHAGPETRPLPAAVAHVDDPAPVLPAGAAQTAALQAGLAAFEKETGIRVLVRFHPASPSAEEDAKPGLYMRALATRLGVARDGALAVYFADEPDWRLWIGDELAARFAGRPGTVAELTANDAIHDAKEALFAAAQAAAARAAPPERLAAQTAALIDGLLARLRPPARSP